jgi:hypothetical protein
MPLFTLRTQWCLLQVLMRHNKAKIKQAKRFFETYLRHLSLRGYEKYFVFWR